MRSCITFLQFFVLITAVPKSYKGYQVVIMVVSDINKLDMVWQWRKQGIDFWNKVNVINHPIQAMIPPHIREPFLNFLDAQYIYHEILIPDVELAIVNERHVQNRRRQDALYDKEVTGKVTANFSYYWQPDEINEYLLTLAIDYPDLVSVQKAGHSYEGRDIYVIKISDSGFQGSKPKIFIDAGIHAREWIAPMAALYLIYELVQNEKNNIDMLDCDWIIIPCVNPDGYQYSHDIDRMWRKTRSYNEGSSCRGVDGNRNYDFFWDYGTGVSTDPCAEDFLGFKPHSESEVRAVAHELEKEADGLRLYISYHSFGNWLIYPWAYEKILHPNHDELEHVARMVSTEIYKKTNRPYTVGNTATILYAATGGSDDYAAGVHNVNLSYTLELTGGKSNGFDLPVDEIISVCKENFIGMRTFANYLAKKYLKKPGAYRYFNFPNDFS